MAIDNEKLELDLKLKHLQRFKTKYDTELEAKYAHDSAVVKGVKVNGTALAIAEGIVDILVATGDADGSVKVNGVDISVKGLAALAYKSEVSEAELSAALKAVIDGKADGADLETLVGEDENMSAREIAAAEVAKVVANAPESFDTLKEIADWIANDTTGAAKMANDITALKTKATLGNDGDGNEYATVKAYVEAVTSGLISLGAISSSTTGDGNAVTAVSYDSATGAISVTKGATYLTQSEVDARIDAKVQYAALADVDALFD